VALPRQKHGHGVYRRNHHRSGVVDWAADTNRSRSLNHRGWCWRRSAVPGVGLLRRSATCASPPHDVRRRAMACVRRARPRQRLPRARRAWRGKTWRRPMPVPLQIFAANTPKAFRVWRGFIQGGRGQS
jgi:hypothetical protein